LPEPGENISEEVAATDARPAPVTEEEEVAATDARPAPVTEEEEVAATDGAPGLGTDGEPAPLDGSYAENGSTTIAPIRWQVAPN
jgi:hypothetical protein